MVNNLKNKKKKKGFTLIELIIVIAIIAILAAIAIPKFGEIRKNANQKADIADAKTIANATIALIGEGTVKPTTADKVITIEAGKESSENPADATEIEKYLQTIPAPKSVGGNFVVTVDKDGNITVTASGETFYPEYVPVKSDED